MNELSERSVGVFDSGYGGVSVLARLHALLPHENFIYYGDSAYAPYGGKTKEEVAARAQTVARLLSDRGVKALVIACNTATAAAASLLRAEYPALPVVGMEPAVKPAALSAEHPRVLIMATEMTLHLEKFKTLMASLGGQADFDLLPCPGLVRLVEAGMPEEETERYLREVFAPYLSPETKPDCIVLGCTHFPFARRLIERVFPHPVRFYDGAEGTARQLKRLLSEKGLLSRRSEEGGVLFSSSSADPRVVGEMEKLFRAFSSTL